MRIVRIVNVVAIAGLLGTATLAYRVKYDATLHAEEVAQLRRSIERERDTMAQFEAEIARRIRPDRVQALVERHLDYEPFTTRKIIEPAALPVRREPVDLIAQKLEMLGLGDLPPPKSTPKSTPKPAPPRKVTP